MTTPQINITRISISRLLVEIGFAKSRSEAKRLIKEGAVSIDGKKVMKDLGWYVEKKDGTRSESQTT